MAKPVLKYAGKQPPLAIIAASKLSGIEIDVKEDLLNSGSSYETLVLPSGEQLQGVGSALRYFGRAASEDTNLYGTTAIDACLIDEWLDRAPSLLAPGSSFEAACAAVSTYLSLRTYMVGPTLTLADLAVWGAISVMPHWLKVRTQPAAQHLARWYNHCARMPALAAIAERYDPKRKAAPINAAASKGDLTSSVAVFGKGGGDVGSFDIDLPDAVEGKVVTRFPPEPSGYLHIGHAKAALLNQYFADLYKGKMLMRFDDTNPSKESDEFVENIMADVKTLGLRHEKLTYTSDYFDQMIDLTRRLIKAGHIYADNTPLEQMREERMALKESACRGMAPEETARVFDEMLKGSEEGKTYCLRIKIDMKSENGSLRDPVVFRCNDHKHWRTGLKYKAYPTYDLACPFVDALEGVTHALRSSEYRDREEQYYRILKLEQSVWPGLPWVHLWDFSRLSFVNTVMSKRKLKWFVDTGRVEGWTDPRFPTVQGLFRRGLQLQALREFILQQGASKAVTFQEWDKIWSMNKRVIDPVCPRHTALLQQDLVPVDLVNGPTTPEVVTIPKHKKHPPAGVKASIRTKGIWLDQADAQVVTEGEEVTLMDWGNCFLSDIERDAQGRVVSIKGRLHLEGNVKTTKWKLTWLPQQQEELVDLLLVDFDHLLTKRKLEEDDSFEDFVNNNSRHEATAWGDPNMRGLQKGDVIQLERRGYFIVDVPLVKPGKQPMVLFEVPDGRATKVSSGKKK